MNKIVIFFAIMLCIGCTEQPSPSMNSQEGIILYLAPPDNCNDFVLSVDNNLYYPLDLPESFQKDSLLVEVEISKTENNHNCGFAGVIPVVTISHIEILERVSISEF